MWIELQHHRIWRWHQTFLHFPHLTQQIRRLNSTMYSKNNPVCRSHFGFYLQTGEQFARSTSGLDSIEEITRFRSNPNPRYLERACRHQILASLDTLFRFDIQDIPDCLSVAKWLTAQLNHLARMPPEVNQIQIKRIIRQAAEALLPTADLTNPPPV